MPPTTPVARIDDWIGAGSFIQAYRALLLGLEAAPRDDVLLAASSRLASALRSRGRSLRVEQGNRAVGGVARDRGSSAPGPAPERGRALPHGTGRRDAHVPLMRGATSG